MKNQKLILFGIILSALLLWEVRDPLQMLSSARPSSLSVFYLQDAGTVSLNPLHSDHIQNLVIMENVVGTLVKYGASGRYFPYLAARWSVSSDRLTWRFYLQNNLFTSDSKPITPQGYILGLKQILRQLTNIGPVPIFENLDGWHTFSAGENLKGLGMAEDGSIEFRFLKAPDGFLEYMSMPYFGYYSPDNFSENGWKDTDRIISSGAYAATKVNEKTWCLSRRDRWPLAKDDSPRTVTITYISKDELPETLENSPTMIYGWPELRDEKNLVKVVTTPTVLVALVVSPYVTNIFADVETRRSFKQHIQSIHSGEQLPSNALITSSFYSGYDHIEAPTDNISLPSLPRIDKRIRMVVSKGLSDMENDYVTKLVTEVLGGSQIEIKEEDRTSPDWMKDVTSNKKWDLRVARVDVGGAPENWVIKMMFCSKLGVNFPDPSGEICKLVDSFQNSDSAPSKEYIQKFNEILNNDAVVIPLWHTGQIWHVSPELAAMFSRTSVVPRFDEIEGFQE